MIIKKPRTYMGHPDQERYRCFFRTLFALPDPARIEREAVAFVSEHSLPMTDFPPFAPLYSRTILYRAESGYEAMAARWSENAVSAIHGHPMFAFYYLLKGELVVTNYEKRGGGVVPVETRTYTPGQYFCMLGTQGTFDNGIHRMLAARESLSIHIYSDDAMKGEVY